MPEQPNQEPNLSALESALAALKPAPAALDRDRLMYRAGQVSARRRNWLWPSAAAALLLVSLGLGAALLARPKPAETIRVVYVEKNPAPESAPAPRPAPPPEKAVALELPSLPASAAYLRTRGEVLRWGAEALPEPPPLTASAQVLSAGDASRALPN
jgi:hypothetical protein